MLVGRDYHLNQPMAYDILLVEVNEIVFRTAGQAHGFTVRNGLQEVSAAPAGLPVSQLDSVCLKLG